jgi:hypothetical protein
MYAFLKEWWEVALSDRRVTSEKATCVPVERRQNIIPEAPKLPPVQA